MFFDVSPPRSGEPSVDVLIASPRALSQRKMTRWGKPHIAWVPRAQFVIRVNWGLCGDIAHGKGLTTARSSDPETQIDAAKALGWA